jgi:methionine sulfoxide reductase heme-binding subunit
VTQAQIIRWGVKPVLWVAGLAPLAWQIWAFVTGNLEAEPVKGMEHFTGRTAIIILFITLTITPIRRLTGWNGLIKVRRLIGLFAFFYALIHFAIFLVFDLELNFGALAKEVVERPWITVGFAALLILGVLAVTSPLFMVRRLGRKWQTLHRLVYLAAALGLLHFFWSQKKDHRLPVIYTAVLGAIFVVKVFTRVTPRSPARPAAP